MGICPFPDGAGEDSRRVAKAVEGYASAVAVNFAKEENLELWPFLPSYS